MVHKHSENRQITSEREKNMITKNQNVSNSDLLNLMITDYGIFRVIYILVS